MVDVRLSITTSSKSFIPTYLVSLLLADDRVLLSNACIQRCSVQFMTWPCMPTRLLGFSTVLLDGLFLTIVTLAFIIAFLASSQSEALTHVEDCGSCTRSSAGHKRLMLASSTSNRLSANAEFRPLGNWPSSLRTEKRTCSRAERSRVALANSKNSINVLHDRT